MSKLIFHKISISFFSSFEKISRKFQRGPDFAECLRIRRTEFTRRDWCLRDVAEIWRKYYALVVYASRVLFIDSRKNPPLLPPSPPQGWKFADETRGETLETRRQEIIIRLDCFSFDKEERTSERDQNQNRNGMFETSLRKFSSTSPLCRNYIEDCGEVVEKRIWRISSYVILICVFQ